MKKVRTILLALVGIASIALGIVMFTKGTGSWERSEAYGGDAYTGIQNAAAQTANNVQDLAEIARFGFGAMLMVGGAAMVVCALPCDTKPVVVSLAEEEKKEQTESITEE